MNKKIRPLIMVTNDDGIHSPGLRAALEAVYELGDILVSAPITQQTGMGRAFPRTAELGIIEKHTLQIGQYDIEAYGVHGSPAYAVAHGVLELADRKPDLCVSGINYGENVGLTLSCSGTLGAVFEADSHEIPGLAVSIGMSLDEQRSNDFSEVDWTSAIVVTRYWAKQMLAKTFPKEVHSLNINIPNRKISVEEYRYTRLDRVNYFEFIKPSRRDYGAPYELRSQLMVNPKKLREDGDVQALYIDDITSITPLGWDLSVPL